MVLDRASHEYDSLLQEARINIIRPLTPIRLLDDHRNERGHVKINWVMHISAPNSLTSYHVETARSVIRVNHFYPNLDSYVVHGMVFSMTPEKIEPFFTKFKRRTPK